MPLEFEKHNVIFSDTGKCAYFSVNQNPNTGKVLIYYRSSHPENQGLAMPTKCLQSDDGINFTKEKTIVENTGACHNFFGFYDQNPESQFTYRGIGGTHWKKKDPFWRIRNKFKGITKNTPETNGWRGLYIYHSMDGEDWEQTSIKPKLCRRALNFQTRGRRQAREFDGHLSAFYDSNKKSYILYTRANVRAGIRHVQYTTSEDFDRWGPFHLVKFTPSFDARMDNYYSPNFHIHPYKNSYFGLLPYCRGKYACLRFVTSSNGTKWKLIKDFFQEKSWYDSGEKDKPKNPCHPVNGYVLSTDKKDVYFYIQHNYFHHNRKQLVTVVRYSMPLEEFMKI
tara:strand:+ start:48 stop:1061 length:1014 start_codon:yes stop_codon:yes gene_type:complete